MNVYVLTYGEYEDTRIIGIFATKELAEQRRDADLLEAAGWSSRRYAVEYPQIEEWALQDDLTCGQVANGSHPCGKPLNDGHTMHTGACGSCEWGYY